MSIVLTAEEKMTHIFHSLIGRFYLWKLSLWIESIYFRGFFQKIARKNHMCFS